MGIVCGCIIYLTEEVVVSIIFDQILNAVIFALYFYVYTTRKFYIGESAH